MNKLHFARRAEVVAYQQAPLPVVPAALHAEHGEPGAPQLERQPAFKAAQVDSGLSAQAALHKTLQRFMDRHGAR
jgi:hypothetical protein